MKKMLCLLMLASICTIVIACSGTTNQGTTGPNTIKMVGGLFATSTILIHKGDTITFIDDSGNGALHILVTGQNAQPESEKGAPDFGGAAGERIDVGETWTSPPWNTSGVFHVTCTVHPSMNLIVTVS